MKNLTPAQIAEEAIGLFIERLEALTVTDEMSENDCYEVAQAQAVAEISEGTSVILPDEQQRLEAAEELLAACKASRHLTSKIESLVFAFKNALPPESNGEGNSIRQDRDLIYHSRSIADDIGSQIEAAIAKAESLPPVQANPEGLPF